MRGNGVEPFHTLQANSSGCRTLPSRRPLRTGFPKIEHIRSKSGGSTDSMVRADGGVFRIAAIQSAKPADIKMVVRRLRTTFEIPDWPNRLDRHLRCQRSASAPVGQRNNGSHAPVLASRCWQGEQTATDRAVLAPSRSICRWTSGLALDLLLQPVALLSFKSPRSGLAPVTGPCPYIGRAQTDCTLFGSCLRSSAHRHRARSRPQTYRHNARRSGCRWLLAVAMTGTHHN